MTGAPPAASQSARLRSSPPLSANLIRESGLHISLSSFWSRVSQMARPRPPPPPSPFFFNHFLHPPPLGPKSCTSHTTTPSPLAQPFHASLHRMRSWDRQCVAICQSHQAPSTTLPFPPLVSSSSTSQSMDGPIPQPRKGYFAICNLQSAICARRADTGQRGNHLDGPTSYHIGTAAGCGIRRPCLRRHCDGAVTTLTSQRASVDCPVSLSVPLACSSSHRHGCCARRRERESGRGERGGDGKCRYL